MNISDYYIILIIGIVVSLLMEEFAGVSTGGMIVPGVLAMHLQNLDVVFFMFFISFVIYLIVDKVLTKHMILYGKRKFAITIILAILFKLLIDQFYPILPFAAIGFRGVSALVPALLANSYSKQGAEFTVPAAIIGTFIVTLIMKVVYLF
ncbi:MAG: poly-gamma-glutamate biosynthesis protein PgsC [Tissierellia bacterium]|nr:poly-gamma-glutamate biosynthesis protein PgsC [Tissierellia bacterium]